MILHLPSWEGASWISSFRKSFLKKSHVLSFLTKHGALHPPKLSTMEPDLDGIEQSMILESGWCNCETEWECKRIFCNKKRAMPWEDGRVKASAAVKRKLEIWTTELRGAPFDLQQLYNAGDEFKTLYEAILQPLSVFMRFLEEIPHRLRMSLSDSAHKTVYNLKMGSMKQSYIDVVIYIIERLVSKQALPRFLYSAEVAGSHFERVKLISLKEEFQEYAKNHLAALENSLSTAVNNPYETQIPITSHEDLIPEVLLLYDQCKSQKESQEINNPNAITPASSYSEMLHGMYNIRKDSGVGINDRTSGVSQNKSEQSHMKRPLSFPNILDEEHSEFDPQNESGFDIQEMFNGTVSQPNVSQERRYDASGPPKVPENTTPTKSKPKKTQKKKTPKRKR